MDTIKRIEFLFDGDKNQISYGNEPGLDNFLFGFGSMNKKKVYFAAVNSENGGNSFEGFKSYILFLESILSDPGPFILILDQPFSHGAAQQSPFPVDPTRLLADQYGVGRWYSLHARLSGKIPQICAVFARMGAALTFPIALCDATAMLSSAGMSIGRSDVVKKMLGEEVAYEKLGGAKMHSEESGSIDYVGGTEGDVLKWVQKYISHMPKQSGLALPVANGHYTDSSSSLEGVIPKNASAILDMDKAIDILSDDNSFFELRESCAKEMITGYARFEGNLAGIVANRSKVKGGALFPESCQKVSRFISICDSFGIPLIFLSDTPGFMVGSKVEALGSIKKGALLFSTIGNTKTAKMSVVVRRSYTAGVYSMAGGGMMPDKFIALPTAIISIYGEAVANRLSPSDQDNMNNLSEMMTAANDPNAFLDQGLIDGIVKMEDLRGEIVIFAARFQDGKRASKRSVLLV